MWQLSVVPVTVMLSRGCCNVPATVCIVLDSNSHMYLILKCVVTDLVHKFLTYGERECHITFPKLVLWTRNTQTVYFITFINLIIYWHCQNWDYIELDDRMIDEWWTGRKQSLPNWGNIPESPYDREITKPSIKITDVLALIQTKHLLETSLEQYH